jgi:hypothetical protein
MSARDGIPPKLLDVVRLRREVERIPAGTRGTVVQVFESGEVVGVEIDSADVPSVDGIVDVAVSDLEVLGGSRSKRSAAA